MTDFSNAPCSLGEERSKREEDGSLRSVRDMLVEALRCIDRGDPDYADLRVGVLVLRRQTPQGPASNWMAGGPDYDQVQGMGILSRAIVSMGSD